VRHEGQRLLLDVGFGPLGPRVPVLFSERESKDGTRLFRVAERRPGDYHLQVLKDGAFFSLYRFELARYGQADCELGHFYSHRHPAAAFVNHLVVSRNLPTETRSLRDLEYRVTKDSETRKQEIRDAGELRYLLVEELGVQVTEAEGRHLYEDLEEQR
jgi:N-hydroxyarylamine O-acetyltransferase